MEKDLNVESVSSRRLRRWAGSVSLLGLGVAVLSGLAGYGNLASFGLLVFALLPWATMIAHLEFTSCMTTEEKAMWRRELPWSPPSAIALWSYMFSTDLKKRAQGFAPHRADPDNAG